MTIDFREIVEIDFKEIVDIDFKEIVEIHFKEIVEMDLKEIVEIGISEIVNCLQRVDSNTSYINQLEIFSLLSIGLLESILVIKYCFVIFHIINRKFPIY